MNVESMVSKCQVVSKYFTGNTVMDESLTDFKEKKSFQGPKNIKAVHKPKPRAKKAVKRIKGQKDIRTALKPQKNELIAYSKDFDNVCKKSGIDVDSEQLQLAIALSKSLQTSESADTPSTSQPLSAQQRTGLIRTTLKEYGFKVPEIKPSVNRKIKKRRKPYKLLLTTKEQKQQIISDKYTQLLFELNNSKTTCIKTDSDTSSPAFYNMATNVNYNNMKDDDVFYVDDLIEKSPNSMGCLLKDWSNIPGRPTSPTQDKSEIIFSEIECSQDEIDIVLSGSLKFSKDILKRKYLYARKSSVCTINETHKEIDPVIKCGDKKSSPDDVAIVNEINTVQEKHLLPVTQPGRSLSPDLFDEDDDDTVVEIIEESPVQLVSNATQVTSTVMDLTKCVNDISQGSLSTYYRNIKKVTQLSQQGDITKRKSNDFMEITDCVGVTSQPIQETIEEHIDLTRHCHNDNVVMKRNIYVDNVEHMDLTQSSNSSTESLPFVHISGKEQLPNKSLDDAIILNDNDCQELNPLKNAADANESTLFTNELNADIDAHESVTAEFKASSDEVIKINSPEKVIQNLPKEASIINLDETSEVDKVEDNIDLTQTSKSNESDIGSPHKVRTCNTNNSKTCEVDKVEDNIDLTQNPKSNESEIGSPFTHKTLNINNGKICEVDKAEHNIDLTQTSKSNESDIGSPLKDTTQCINNSKTCKLDKAENDIDLIQTSKSSEWDIGSPSKYPMQCINNSSLGKKDDVSVDYDEALENMNCYVDYAHNSNFNDDNTELEHNVYTQNLEVTVSNGKHVEVVELNTSESNSPNKDAEHNFDIGGLSVIADLQSFNRQSRNTLNMPDGTVFNESLPVVNIKRKNPPSKPESPFEEFLDPIVDHVYDKSLINNVQSTTNTPSKEANMKIAVTPKQSEYIVKTDNVTPMVDYAAMTSPERNRELDKYGLKPFKRKRAIQLLTHLYNQTHPFVESTQELTSPSKRRKLSLSQPSTSTSKSPRKIPNSPRKFPNSPKKFIKQKNTYKSPSKGLEDSGSLNGTDKENYMFMVTSEVPTLRDIDCGPDDWVFQKREKAKLHTCRVPLHIAFHNFVSCRRLLHEAILRYEPVNIDVIHKELVATGHRYDPKDLLKFMDKKCITVKTADNAKNKNHY